MSKNSLATLIGQYSSDSDNDEDTSENSQQQIPVSNAKKPLPSKCADNQLPTTNWTQCTDPKSGHPYYWNVETKDVTWEPPIEYENYLSTITELFKEIPNDCWIRGYSQAVEAHYYVNEYTRVVCWEKPENFKEPPTQPTAPFVSGKIQINSEKTAQTSSDVKKLKKERIKKSVPLHLLNHSSDDEKIELITEYNRPSESSSDEERKSQNGKASKDIENMKNVTGSSNCNLVAAYTTDESDSDEKIESNISVVTKSVPEADPKNDEPISQCKKAESEDNASSEINKNPPTTQTFSNIIVGGVSESTIDEEIMRLKMELEQDFNSFEAEEIQKPEKEENSFNEKTFQRKKRIQFKTKIETKDSEEATSKDQSLKDIQTNAKNNLYKNFLRSHVEFEKNDENDVVHGPVTEVDANSKAEDEKLKSDVDEMSNLIAGKVKFLAIGHPDVTAVQAMGIQLETLLAAYRSSSLDLEYFFKWLKLTSDDLMTLEMNACPDGWKCMWDRKNSRYYYKNLDTGKMQWEFPEELKDDDVEEAAGENDGNVGGEDEMDICTTPPPNENEQLQIESGFNEFNPPPPPVISALKPPPPPNINCELASFYSDIASLGSPSISITDKETDSMSPSSNKTDTKKRLNEDSTVKRKRKKIKTSGMAIKLQEVSTMVANWKKAQKELDN